MQQKASRCFLFGISLAVVAVFSACLQAPRAFPQEKPIHPKVFSMIECWLSDTESPIVTEINLDAVDINRNQFDGEHVRIDGDRVIYEDTDTRVSMSYRIIENANGHETVEYFENEGGTLTTKRIISFAVEHRDILVDSKETRCRILRVLSIKSR